MIKAYAKIEKKSFSKVKNLFFGVLFGKIATGQYPPQKKRRRKQSLFKTAIY
jgi:hypothetical protein